MVFQISEVISVIFLMVNLSKIKVWDDAEAKAEVVEEVRNFTETLISVMSLSLAPLNAVPIKRRFCDGSVTPFLRR